MDLLAKTLLYHLGQIGGSNAGALRTVLFEVRNNFFGQLVRTSWPGFGRHKALDACTLQCDLSLIE
jgi:hypothetical protein